MKKNACFWGLTIIPVFLAVFCLCAYGAGNATPDEGAVVLGVGDRIAVRIPVEPRYTGEYTIDERGKFYLPIIDEGLDFGAFSVAGLTTGQATDLIKQKLSEYYADSDVIVELVSMGIRPGQSVSVFGMVSTSGSFRYFDGMKILDLLLKIGSFSGNADLSRVALYRGSEPIRYLDIRDLVSGKDLTNNIEVKPGDYFIVPTMDPPKEMRVVVIGSVLRPGTIFVPDGTQILDLIGRTGGYTTKASPGQVLIIRVNNGEPVVIHSDLKALIDQQDLKENVPIKDGDIVFVPANSRVKVSSIINSLLQLDIIKRFSDTVDTINQ